MIDNKMYFETKVNDKLSALINEERTSVGFYDLCDQETVNYHKFAASVQKKHIVVIGIGGSALGASAVYEFLDLTHNFEKRLHIMDTTDPLVLKQRMREIDLEDAFFFLISKSGTTVETIALFKYISSQIEIDRDDCVVITDKGSALEKFADAKGVRSFHIPDNVGGRFSVLSAVGLLPLATVGVDIEALLSGAKKIRDSFFNNEGYCHTLLTKATYYAQKSNTYNVNCLFSYSEAFRQFNAWYVQLWGESLGKKQIHSELHVGLTPVGLIGPTDQHSFLQLIVEGKRDKTVTVIKIKNFDNELSIPNTTLEHLEGLDMLNGYKFSELINMQADSIIESLESLERSPLDVIEIDSVNAVEIGALIMYYELLTALVAKMLDINAYDQPGVEMGKQILKAKLNS